MIMGMKSLVALVIIIAAAVGMRHWEDGRQTRLGKDDGGQGAVTKSGVAVDLGADPVGGTSTPVLGSPSSEELTAGGIRKLLARFSTVLIGTEPLFGDPVSPRNGLEEKLSGVFFRAYPLAKRVPESGQVRPSDQKKFSVALLASKPAPTVLGSADIFAPMLGSWDVDVVFYQPDGTVEKRVPGEWHFARTLEGRGIEDVWIVPPRTVRDPQDPKPGEYGETVRFYDPRINAWHCVWHGVVNGIVWPFIGRAVGNEVVLERVDGDGKLTHWVFFEMREASFRWRSETSVDGGATWQIEQEMWAMRQ